MSVPSLGFLFQTLPSASPFVASDQVGCCLQKRMPLSQFISKCHRPCLKAAATNYLSLHVALLGACNSFGI